MSGNPGFTYKVSGNQHCAELSHPALKAGFHPPPYSCKQLPVAIAFSSHQAGSLH